MNRLREKPEKLPGRSANTLWESFFCVFFSFGLIGLFKEYMNSQNGFQRFLSDNAFGVYVFHAPIITGISVLCRGIALHPIAKFFIISALAVPVCFVSIWLLRKIPVFRTIFS